MNPSIRAFLLLNLLLCVTLITSLAIIGNLFLAHREIQAHLDNQLVRTAYRLHAIFTPAPNAQQLKSIQQQLFNPSVTPDGQDNTKQALDTAIQFQLWSWSHGSKRLLYSKHAPKVPLSTSIHTGISNHLIQGHNWRVYTLHDPKNQLSIMVANQSTYRQMLENHLTRDSVLIMLLTYPFLGILIWVIVGRGLSCLKNVTREVKNRDTKNLQPVNLEAVPNEIKTLVGELNQLFSRLDESFSRYERFTADAAHELRTPLAALSAQTQVALRAETQEARNQALLKVLGGVNRCTHVVQQLLILSRLVPENGINDPTSVVLSKQASEIAAMLVPEAISKNIDLELLAPDHPGLIIGNITAINILMRNLIDNAIRYTEPDKKVSIDIEGTEQHLIFKVIDNGPGIPEELRHRVFQRFYRMVGNNTTGSGLGLSIVAQIAQLHGAEVQLLTPDNKQGLAVHVIFPKAPPTPDA